MAVERREKTAGSLRLTAIPRATRWREGELFGFVLRRVVRGQPLPVSA